MNLAEAIETEPTAVRTAVRNMLNNLVLSYLDESFQVLNRKNQVVHTALSQGEAQKKAKELGDGHKVIFKRTASIPESEETIEESFEVRNPAGKAVHTAFTQSEAQKKAKELGDGHKVVFKRTAVTSC